MANLTPEQMRYLMQFVGNDVDGNMLYDPNYRNEMIQQNMRTPNSVVDPKTGQYLGEYEMMPQSGLLQGSMTDADLAMMQNAAMQRQQQEMMNRVSPMMSGALTDQDVRMIEQGIKDSGNQIMKQSRYNLSNLLKRLGMN